MKIEGNDPDIDQMKMIHLYESIPPMTFSPGADLADMASEFLTRGLYLMAIGNGLIAAAGGARSLDSIADFAAAQLENGEGIEAALTAVTEIFLADYEI